jgi:hypothetical protein
MVALRFRLRLRLRLRLRKIKTEIEIKGSGFRNQDSAILHYPTHIFNCHPEAIRFSVWPKDLDKVKVEVKKDQDHDRDQGMVNSCPHAFMLSLLQ